MKFEQLSAEDQALLKTDLGEFDKVASEQVAIVREMYDTGFEKLAAEAADAMDAQSGEEEKTAEEAVDEEFEKNAAELGAFIEKGFVDGLVKLGQERHNDGLHYLMPYVIEKVGSAASEAAKASFLKRMQGHAASAAKAVRESKAVAKGKEVAHKAVDAAKSPIGDIKAAIKGHKPMVGAAGAKRDMLVSRKHEAAKGVGKLTGLGLAGYGGSKLLGKKEA